MSVLIEKRIFATPLSRKIALERQINLSDVKGSGPNGRITSKDVLLSCEKPNLAGGLNFQKSSSRKMTVAGSTPQFSLTIECRADTLVVARKKWNESRAAEDKVTFNDMITKAAACALLEHTHLLNICQQAVGARDEKVDVSLAVNTPRGLVTPVLKEASEKKLGDISKSTGILADKAKQGRLSPSDLNGGLFTITNLGKFRIREFVPVLNPPQAFILAIGEICQLPVVVSGQIEVGWLLRITAGADHRLLNGVEMAEYLEILRKKLEQPMFWNL